MTKLAAWIGCYVTIKSDVHPLKVIACYCCDAYLLPNLRSLLPRYYEEAWQRSQQRHTRSQRSLGRNAVQRKEYAKAAEHYQLALAINPLHPDAWFSLGYCYLKTDQPRKALQVRRRAAGDRAGTA